MVPKFSANNLIHITLFQQYPTALEDLTLTKECLIEKYYSVEVVVKLQPGDCASSANYHTLHSYFIIIP